jgi:tRNA A37 N6-isopentenylltransferase MiaA
MANTFEDNMNSAEYQCAQGCYIFLEELLNHMDLRDRENKVLCAVGGSCFYFHKRGAKN